MTGTTVRREALDIPDEIRTPHLLLRSARPGDAPALYDAIESSLPEFFPWLAFSAKQPDLETLERVSTEAQEKFAAHEFFVWRVWEPDGNTMVGTVDLHSIHLDAPSCEIGFWMRTSHTGRGLAKEAVNAIIDVALEHLGALRIEARCDTRNERACRFIERLGFVFEGIARNDDRDAAGQLCSTRVYALTRDDADGEWHRQRASP